MIGKFLKKVDLYGKLPSGLAESTMSGAAVSMVTMAFLALMVISELIEYVSIEVSTDMFIDDAHSQEKVMVNMNVNFPNLPCEFLEVDAFDALGQVVTEQNKDLIFKRIQNGLVMDISYKHSDFNLDEAKLQVTQQNGCAVIGSLNINKVPGKITFGPHRNHFHINNVQRGLVLDVSHNFKTLKFGRLGHIEKVKKNFDQGQLETLEGTGRTKLADLAQVPVQHEHFVSIIPTEYTLLNNQQFSVYQYTANHNEIRAQYYPLMIIRYDFSPVSFRFWQTKEDWMHFVVQLCAIIGGIFTVSSMIESVIYKAMQLSKKINLSE